MGISSKRFRCSITAFNNSTVKSDSYNGGKFDCSNHVRIGIQANVAGTSVAGSINLEYSDDGSTWNTIGTAQTISAAGTFWLQDDAYHMLYRLTVTSSNANDMTVEAYGIAKEG